MLDCKANKVPMHQNFKLIWNMKSSLTDVTFYRRKVNKLMYLAHTWLDISLAMNIVSKFITKLQKVQMDVVTQILKYIKGTFDYGICFWHGENGALQGCVDTNWARDFEHWRSMFSFIFTLGTSPISWSTNNQSSMETSSTKAKYRVMTKATKETMWLRYMLIEFKLF